MKNYAGEITSWNLMPKQLSLFSTNTKKSSWLELQNSILNTDFANVVAKSI